MRRNCGHLRGRGVTTIRFMIQEYFKGIERSYVSFMFVPCCRRMAFEAFEVSSFQGSQASLKDAEVTRSAESEPPTCPSLDYHRS